MNWVFYALVAAAILHVMEEHAYPGGFPAFMKKMTPPLAPYITANFAMAFNGLFLLLCAAAAMMSQRAPVFSLSVAALCGLNGMAHVLGTIRARQYAPGLLTGVLLYLPLAVLAYRLFVGSGKLSVEQGVGSAVLGMVYQVVPIIYLGLAYAVKRG